ncbi:MAG: secretin N-terminal domain-containing protein, partial [Phycisphaerae bacterium]
MRHVTKLLGTGCFFLCLGGWGYNAQVIGETNDPKAAIGAAVAAAAATPTAPANTALAEGPVAPVAPAVPVAPVAPPTAAAPNLNAAVVNVGADGTVEQFDAPDLDINTALYLLSLQTKRNIIASKEVKGTITAHLHAVTFTEALEAILTPNGFGYIEKGNFIYVYSAREIEDIRKRDRKTINRIFRLKYVSAVDAQTLIKPMLSTTGQIALTPAATIGIATSATDTGGNAYATDDTLVVNDYVDNLNEIEKNLKVLDIRPKQVLIESTILRAILSED